MDFIIAPIVVGICVFGTYKLFELFACRRERLTLIEKLDPNVPVEFDKFKLPSYTNVGFSFNALKVGCLLIGLGLGLLVGFVICASYIPDYVGSSHSWETREVSGLIYGASVLLFGGIGLITAFLIEMKLARKGKEK